MVLAVISWSALYLLFEWAVRLGMLVIVTRKRREPVSALAWLAVVFFQPLFGVLLYLLFGENRVSRGRMQMRRRLIEQLDSTYRRIGERYHSKKAELGERLHLVSMLAERLGGMRCVHGNTCELFGDTDEMVDALVRDIDRASHHVHLLFYIYADDATGGKVADALGRAAGRGVQCRVLVDDVGSSRMLKTLARRMRHSGVNVVPMLPVGVLRSLVARMDLRNHRKIAVIDGKIGYTGSQNIVDASYGHEDLAWHDLMLRTEGPLVLELQTVFLSDWFLETGDFEEGDAFFPETPEAGDCIMQALPSGPGFSTENYQRMLLHALHSARERVVITTPYFIPDEAFLQALEVAVLRGVEVKLAVPERSDQILVGYASSAYYEELMEIGVEIWLYQPGLLHAKTMTVDDDLAFFGSSNFDIRSFQLNAELTIVMYGGNVADTIRSKQDGYLNDSRMLDRDEWAARDIARKVIQNAMKLFSPLL